MRVYLGQEMGGIAVIGGCGVYVRAKEAKVNSYRDVLACV